MKLLKILPIVGMFGLSGCGKLIEDVGLAKKDKNESKSSYIGTWETECRILSSDLIGDLDTNSEIGEIDAYHKYFLEFTKDKIINKAILSGSKDCVQDIVSIGREQKIDKFGKSENSISKIDLSLSSITRTYHSDQLILIANRSKEYGYSNWKINEPKEISGLKETYDSEPVPKKGTLNFNIVKVEQDKLWMGKKSSITEKNRPIELDETGYKRITK